MRVTRLTIGIGKTDGKGFRCRWLFRIIGSYFPNPTPVRAYIWLQSHIGRNYIAIWLDWTARRMAMRVLTDMISAHFQSLVASHYKPHFLSLSVWQQTDIASSTFFPFWRFCVESKELCTPSRNKDGELLLISIAIVWIRLYAHLEKDILVFLVCFCVYLFCKLDYGLEMGIWLLVLESWIIRWSPP